MYVLHESVLSLCFIYMKKKIKKNNSLKLEVMLTENTAFSMQKFEIVMLA